MAASNECIVKGRRLAARGTLEFSWTTSRCKSTASDVVAPLLIETPDVHLGVHVHQRLSECDDEDTELISVFVIEVVHAAASGHLLVAGTLSRCFRMWDMDGSGEMEYFQEPPITTWLSGNGHLFTLAVLPTYMFTVRVDVYVTDVAEVSPSANMRSLRALDALNDVVLRANGRDFPAHR